MSRRHLSSQLPHSLAIASSSSSSVRDSSSFAIDDRDTFSLPQHDTVDPQMMFGLDLDDSMYDRHNSNNSLWSATAVDYLASPLAETMSPNTFASPTSPHKDAFFESSMLLGRVDERTTATTNDYFHPWLNESAFETTSTAPIAIPEAKSPISPSFGMGYHPSEYHSPFFQDASSFSPPFAPSSFSPDSDYAALASPISPPVLHSDLPHHHQQQQQQQPYGTPIDAMAQMSISPHDTLAWATLNGGSPGFAPASPPHPNGFPPHSFAPSLGMPRPTTHRRLSTTSTGAGVGGGALLFQPSASAPSALSPLASMHRPVPSRAFTGSQVHRRSESVSTPDDATAPSSAGPIRRRRRGPSEEADAGSPPSPVPGADKPLADGVSTHKSLLRPPKLAPSAWQLYFTDWIQRHQASSTKKLNVAQAAKEAGQEYAALSSVEKEPYKRRSQALKEARERELDAYMRTLTPDDIKRENAFRTAQRKAGKSRRGNIKDPNAPKKPLSAYFMFLQRIRADPELVADVFGDETETTKQSVLAAEKWRSMTDEERKPFLAQAEQEKLEYEAARKLYEEGTTGHTGSYNFSILAANPLDLASIPRSAHGSSSSSIKREVPDADGFVISTAASLRA